MKSSASANSRIGLSVSPCPRTNGAASRQSPSRLARKSSRVMVVPLIFITFTGHEEPMHRGDGSLALGSGGTDISVCAGSAGTDRNVCATANGGVFERQDSLPLFLPALTLPCLNTMENVRPRFCFTSGRPACPTRSVNPVRDLTQAALRSSIEQTSGNLSFPIAEGNSHVHLFGSKIPPPSHSSNSW